MYFELELRPDIWLFRLQINGAAAPFSLCGSPSDRQKPSPLAVEKQSLFCKRFPFSKRETLFLPYAGGTPFLTLEYTM